MGCPLFEDFTRRCTTEFKELMLMITYGLCESDTYKVCPAYLVVSEKKQPCKYFHECTSQFKGLIEEMGKNPKSFEKMLKIVGNYCLSDNKINCARIKFLKAGKDAPKDLFMDGSKVVLEIKE
jgi:hypothetical protein